MKRFGESFKRIKVIEHYLIPSILREDETVVLVVRPMTWLAVISFALGITYSILWVTLTPQFAERIVYPLLTSGACGLSLVLVRYKRWRLARNVILVVPWVIIAIAVFTAGGTLSPTYSLLTIVVIVAAYLGGWGVAFGYALATILLGYFMVWLDPEGTTLEPFATPANAWLTQSLIMVMVIVVTYFMLHRSGQALQKARESEERFRLISSLTSDYSFSSRYNAQGELEHVFLTGAFEAITGYTPEEFSANGGWRATLHPDDWVQDDRDMEAIHQNRRVVTEVRIIRKGGDVRWVRVYAQPIWDEQANCLIGVNGGVQDITERKLVEEALRESERLYREINEMISDYAYAYDILPDGSFTPAWVTDDAFERLTGYSRDEVGSTLRLYHPDSVEMVQEDLRRTLAGETTAGDYQIITKSGETRWVHIERRVEWDPEQRPIRFYGAARDITEQKLAEEALRDSERRYRVISEMISDYAYAYDILPDGSLIPVWMTDDSFLRLTGYTWDETGASYDLYHPDDAELVRQHVEETIKGNPQSGEYRIVTKNGEMRWLRIERRVKWDEQHQRPIRLYGVASDITERKQAEQALAESEKKFRTIFELAPYGITIQQGEGVFVDFNQAFLETIGLTADEVRGVSALEMSQMGDPNSIQNLMQELRTSGRLINREMPIYRADGSQRLLLISSQPLELAGKRSVLTVAVDITQRKRAEEKLQASEERLRQALDAAHMGTWEWDVMTGEVIWSEHVTRILGLEPDEFDGTYEGYLSLIYPPDRPMVEQALNDALLGRVATYSIEHRIMSSRGGMHWLEAKGKVYRNQASEPVRMAGTVHNVTERKQLEAELQRYTNQLEQLVDERTNALRLAKEQFELILNTTASALAFAHPNGDILTTNPAFRAMFGEDVNGSVEDLLLPQVDDSKQAETIRNALQDVIQHGERRQLEFRIIAKGNREIDIDLIVIPMKAVEEDTITGILISGHNITHLKEIERFKARFVADAVHDLATPISALSSRLYLLQRSPERLTDHTRALEHQVGHLRNLVDDLRILSQMDRGEVELNLTLCNFNKLVERVFDTYEPVALEKQQSLKLKIDPTLPEVCVDERQIERALVNLVSNAVNYTPKDKEINIDTALDGQGQNVIISVVDQGIGIDTKDLPYIFDRFFRSGEARARRAGGSGLGLAITRQIIEMHEGSITVTSDPGIGSTFTIRLPV